MKSKNEVSINVETKGCLGIILILLTIVFIVLKLTNVIDWSWLWVLAPFWIPWAIVLGVLAVIGVGWVVLAILGKK